MTTKAFTNPHFHETQEEVPLALSLLISAFEHHEP